MNPQTDDQMPPNQPRSPERQPQVADAEQYPQSSVEAAPIAQPSDMPNENQPVSEQAPTGVVPPVSQPPVSLQAPVAPQSPVFPQAAAPETPAASHSSHKGLIIGLIAGAAALLIGIVAAVILFMVFHVSAADYKQANDVMTDVKSAYTDISTPYMSPNATEVETKNNLEAINKAKTEFDAKLDELGKTKAVSRDGKLHQKYVAVTDKKPEFDIAMAAMNEAYTKIIPSMLGLKSVTSASSAMTQIKSVRDDLKEVSGLKDENNKELVTRLITLLDKFTALAEKVQTGRDDYRKYDSKAVSDFYTTSSDIDDALRDWQSNLKKLADQGELNDELNDLSQAIFEKSLKQ